MNTEKKNVVLINASPKATNISTSGWLTSFGESCMRGESMHISSISLRKSIATGLTKPDYEAMLNMDALVFIFPLYIYCLPGMLMGFLQDFYQYYNERKDKVGGLKVYAVVNCGFPETDINMEAARVIQSFSEKINASFRFGVFIGKGSMILKTKNKPFMKRTRSEISTAFELLKKDVLYNHKQSIENVHISANFPKKLFFFLGSRHWISEARKNGLRKKDLYRRPYVE